MVAQQNGVHLHLDGAPSTAGFLRGRIAIHSQMHLKMVAIGVSTGSKDQITQPWILHRSPAQLLLLPTQDV